MSETILFFGSGPVAAQSLKLLAQDFEIEAVVTKPKPEHHHGSFPVLDTAAKLGVPIHTVSNKVEMSGLITEEQFKSRVGVLIDFGIIVTQDVIDYFPLGIVNSHFSILPEWRGADPITFAILSGQPKTGVSLMVIDAGLDTGKIIAQKSIPISGDDTVTSLTQRLIGLSHKLLTQHLPLYVDGSVNPRNQPHPDRATHSRKLTKDDGVIDWHKPAVQIEREVRAFIEWPKSRATLGDKEVIVTKAEVVNESGTPGEVRISNKELLVCCGEKALRILKLKPAGKGEMTAEAFLAGYKIRE